MLTAVKTASRLFRHQVPCTNKTISRPLIKFPKKAQEICPGGAHPCLDLKNIVIERGVACHANAIKSFLCQSYWPREPTIVSLWMNLNSSYLQSLSDKYAYSGDRFVASEIIRRTQERRIVGLLVATKVFPWMIDELNDWSRYTQSVPERNRMFFFAHVLKSADLFKKYDTPFVYDVEVLGTSADVTGHGIGKMLLRYAMAESNEIGIKVMQVIAVSKYAAKICKSCGMNLEWSMDYSDFVDQVGKRIFYPRRPHGTVEVYVKVNEKCK